MKFEEILFRAKQGERNALEQILEIFKPMLIKNSLINGKFDDDLYQDLVIETLRCIQYFRKFE